MSTKIRFLGIAAYEITLPDGRVVLIDPCLSGNPASPVQVDDLERVDLLLITHLALDHLGDSVAIIKKFGCPVVCGSEVKYFLGASGVDTGLVRTVPWHGQVNPLGILIRSVPSMHGSTGLSPDGKWLSGPPMGFILHAADDCRIYHSGDTAIFSDLKLIGHLYQPNIGLMCACELEAEYLESLGLKDHYGNEMSGVEGAMAAEWMELEYAFICHYLSPDGRKDVDDFMSMLSDNRGPKPVAPHAGETFMYPPQEV